MTARPPISDKTAEKIKEWMKNNPEKGISSLGKAIEYLVDKGIRADEKALTEKEITERLEKLEEKIDD
jgi:hypothetical protein